MSSIRCPICGGKVRITRYKLGGGRVDCFRCRTTWIGSRTENGYGIYGIRFRHPKRPHSGTEMPGRLAGKGKHPVEIGDPVRQVTNQEVSA